MTRTTTQTKTETAPGLEAPTDQAIRTLKPRNGKQSRRQSQIATGSMVVVLMASMAMATYHCSGLLKRAGKLETDSETTATSLVAM